MMKGIDPRAVDVLPTWADDDTSDELRLLMGAARVKAITAFFNIADGPTLETEVDIRTLPDWLRANERTRLADGLQEHFDLRDSLAAKRLNASPLDMSGVAVDTDRDSPSPLTTREIAECLNGLRWQAKAWKKTLGNKPAWLRECCAVPGKRGVRETTWNPVKICSALVLKGHIKPNNARARFQSQHALLPWLEQWKTYEAEHFDSA